MATPIDIRELPSRIDEALLLADAGDDVILTEGSIPRARLVPIRRPESVRQRVPDLHPGAMETTDDFDAPLPDEFWTGQQ